MVRDCDHLELRLRPLLALVKIKGESMFESDIQEPKEKEDFKKVIPKKDFVIHQNEIHIELKKGEVVEVPLCFLDNLRAEKVI